MQSNVVATNRSPTVQFTYILEQTLTNPAVLLDEDVGLGPIPTKAQYYTRQQAGAIVPLAGKEDDNYIDDGHNDEGEDILDLQARKSVRRFQSYAFLNLPLC